MNAKQLIVMTMAVVVIAIGWLSQRPKEPEFKCPARATVVYTTQDVPEGATIPTEALEERSILASRLPQDAITSASLAAGRVAKYGIAKGSIVSQHDLAAQD